MDKISRDLDLLNAQIEQVFNNWINQLFKTINISMPAIVVSFDETTKRAMVQPALRSLFNTTEGIRSESRPPISDVPVMFPSAGGFVHYFPIKKGDILQLFYNHRGLEYIKKTWGESDPDDVLSGKDVVAYAGWGGQEISPVESEAMCLQKEDGTSVIKISSDGSIVVETNSQVTINPESVCTVNGNLQVNGGLAVTGDMDIEGISRISGGATISSGVTISGSLTNNGTNVGSTHRHSGVDLGPHFTQGPS